MSEGSPKEAMALAYTTATATEVIVVRGLLESAGIYARNPDSAEPFPFNEPSELTNATDVYVPESRVKEARGIIEDYLRGNAHGDSAQGAE